MRRLPTTAVAAVVAFTACTTTAQAQEPGTDGAAPMVVGQGPPGEAGPPVTVPVEDPAGAQVAWTVEQLNAPASPPVEAVAARVAPDLAGAGYAEQLIAVLDTYRPSGPFTVTGYEQLAPTAATAVITSATEELRVTVVVQESGLLVQWLVQPAIVVPQVDEWADLDETLEGIGADAALLGARIGDDGCEPVHGLEADELMPVGSVFKLYVLAALSDAVQAGTASYDELLTVTDDLKSLPSGQLQDRPSGTQVSVREAATLMITISDNTATDMLIDRLGRAAVEDAVVDLGHTEPDVLRPFPDTRELFQLAAGPQEQRTAWAEGDEAERRALLDQLPGGPPAIDPLALFTQPMWTDGLEWFASPDDVCAVYDGLLERGGTDPFVLDVLAQGASGAGLSPEEWPYVGFKGGNTPGSLTLSYLAQDSSGEDVVLVVSLTSEDPVGLLDTLGAVDLAEAGFELLS